MRYLRRNILYIKWKYDVDITTTNIQQCITGKTVEELESKLNIDLKNVQI